MKKMNGREMKVFFVLSLVVPLGLLTSFRFVGVLPEPPKLETITTEPVNWQIDRPKRWIMVDDLIEKTFTNEEVSVKMGLHSLYWIEDKFDGGIYLGRDGLDMSAFADANMKSDYVATVSIKLYPADSESFVYVRDGQIAQVIHNATVISMESIGTNQSEASVQVKATSRTMYFGNMAHWIFQNDNPEDHQLKIVFEFTYRNASIYKNVMVPMLLTILKDTGDTFEDSRQVQEGEHAGTLDNVDYIDMYKSSVQEGQTLKVTLTPPEDANYDIYLYDANRDVIANSTQEQDSQETITYTASASQDYYLKVIQIDWSGHSNEGVYILRIEIKA